MERVEKRRRLTIVIENDRDIRGGFLIQTTRVDHIIADILTTHFTINAEKYRQLYSYVIMPELNFRRKIEIFKKILKRYYKDLFNENLFKSLERITKFRNRIAHALLDDSVEFLEGDYINRLSFVYFKDREKKRQIITKKNFQERTKECDKVWEELKKIRLKLVAVNKSGNS